MKYMVYKKVMALGNKPPEIIQLLGNSHINNVKKSYFNRITQLIDASAYGFYIISPQSDSPISIDSMGASKEFLKDYEEHGRNIDPLLKHLHTTRKIVHNHTVLTKSLWEKHKLHHLMSDHGLKWSLQGPILVKEEIIGTINIARRKNDKPFGEKDIQIARNITELLSINIEYSIQVETQKKMFKVYNEIIDNYNQGVVSINSKGDVLFSSIGKNLINIILTNQLSIIDTLMIETRKLLGSTQNEQEIQYHTLKSKHPIVVKSYKMPDSCVLHFISCNKRLKWENIKQILTPREQEIVYWICEGEKPNDIANNLYISPHTVQQHIKNIYKKARVNSRADLITIVMDLRGDISSAK